MQWNAASDNTGESREGVGGGSIERGAASGRPDCSRRARGGLMVLKEGIDGGVGSVACVRVWCVCVSLPCVSLCASRSLPSWLALARNGAGRRLTDGNNVQYSRSSAALAAERRVYGVVHAPCSGRQTGIRELVPPKYAQAYCCWCRASRGVNFGADE